MREIMEEHRKLSTTTSAESVSLLSPAGKSNMTVDTGKLIREPYYPYIYIAKRATNFRGSLAALGGTHFPTMFFKSISLHRFRFHNMASSVTPLVELSSGERMPVLGLGTWGMFDEELENAVITALDTGYRHFDTAFFHANEETIGVVFNEWIEAGKVTRSDLFITSKLPPTGMTPSKVKHFCDLSLENLKLSYLDLYLIQLPVGIKYRSDDQLLTYQADGSLAVECIVELADIWKEMEALVEEGHVKSIGICNFKLEQLEKLLESCAIKPAVVQVELHAYCQQKELRDFCKEHHIVVASFCPLGSPGRDEMFVNGSTLCLSVMQDPVVIKLAEKCDKTPAQILLRHALQNGVTVVPKSATSARVQENFNIFNFFLTPNEMKLLNTLDKGQYARSFNYSFLGEAFLSHPNFPFEGEPVDEPVSHH